MKNVIIALLIVIAVAGIGFAIYQQINTLKVELQQKLTVQELMNKYEASKTELMNKYEASKTELINKYETELRNVKESNDRAIQQFEAEIRKIKEESAQKTDTTAKITNDNNKTIMAILKKLQSTADVYTYKPVETDPTAFVVNNNRANYKDYSTKVMDAKIGLDLYLNDSKETLPADAGDLITKAIGCYIDAVSIWDMAIDNERKEEPKGESEKERTNRTNFERKRQIEKSILYGNKYSGLIQTPYIKMIPEGYILVPLKAVTFVWALASQYVNQADNILSQSVK